MSWLPLCMQLDAAELPKQHITAFIIYYSGLDAGVTGRGRA